MEEEKGGKQRQTRVANFGVVGEFHRLNIRATRRSFMFDWRSTGRLRSCCLYPPSVSRLVWLGLVCPTVSRIASPRFPAENPTPDVPHPGRCTCRARHPDSDPPSSCTTMRMRRRPRLPSRRPGQGRCRLLRCGVCHLSPGAYAVRF